MGRYYSGDIEGKFWFGVQSSDDAAFFGGSEEEPNYIRYFFSSEDLGDVERGINACLEKLGDNKSKLDRFFEENNGYNDVMLIKAGFDSKKIGFLLEWYARLHLGEKIADCIKRTGSCEFEAEL